MTFKNTKKEQPQSVFWGNKYLEHFPSFARAYLIETHNVSLFSFSEQIILKKKKELFLFLERKKKVEATEYQYMDKTDKDTWQSGV